MRTKLSWQPGLDTTDGMKCRPGHICSFTIIAAVILAISCTRGDKQRDTSTMPDVAQKTTAAESHSGPRAQTVCELLTANEIAGILKSPQVKKDEIHSRRNEFTKVDFCYWWPSGKVNPDRDERIELMLRRAESADEGSLLMLFSAAKGDAFEHDVERDRTAQPVPGRGR